MLTHCTPLRCAWTWRGRRSLGQDDRSDLAVDKLSLFQRPRLPDTRQQFSKVCQRSNDWAWLLETMTLTKTTTTAVHLVYFYLFIFLNSQLWNISMYITLCDRLATNILRRLRQWQYYSINSWDIRWYPVNAELCVGIELREVDLHLWRLVCNVGKYHPTKYQHRFSVCK